MLNSTFNVQYPIYLKNSTAVNVSPLVELNWNSIPKYTKKLHLRLTKCCTISCWLLQFNNESFPVLNKSIFDGCYSRIWQDLLTKNVTENDWFTLYTILEFQCLGEQHWNKQQFVTQYFLVEVPWLTGFEQIHFLVFPRPSHWLSVNNWLKWRL